jgi:hypothetical protein
MDNVKWPMANANGLTYAIVLKPELPILFRLWGNVFHHREFGQRRELFDR